MKYYLGLDNGGTTTKAALFDMRGRQIAVASMNTASITPKPGFVERDMEEMWQANCAVTRQAVEKAGIDAGDIAGLGICGHGKGLYLWGKDGRPARNGIISTDNRAYAYPVKWQADGTEEKAFALSCQHVMACQPVALLAWLKEHEPEAYANIGWVFEAKDYVRFRMTGKALAEYTDYSGANLLNLHTRSYDPELLKLFGIGEIIDALPPLCEATQICGAVTAEAAALCGLREGTPVIGGMFDIDACALGVGIVDEQRLCMIAGTWSINEYIRKSPVLDGSVRMNSLFALPEYYLIEESSPTSAGNNAWFMKQLLPELIEREKAAGRSIYDKMNEWVEAIPPEEFVPVFLPFLMASNVHPNAKSCFVGMSVNHTRKHLLRSVYEGIAFCHKMHIDRLLKSRETKPLSVRLAGGAANSAVWTQMFADILQLPVETVSAGETGALGCAIAVAAAVGDYADLNDAAAHMCEVSPAVLPDGAKAEIYAKKYALYKKTIEALDGLWDDMQALIES
ncbi:MAG: carbohydrate kinase [Oscillospiraceae bacterium]|nr:carbohydrate kinase [Oscillospiraceae bacterium]